MAELLLLNPRGRRRKARKARSANPRRRRSRRHIPAFLSANPRRRRRVRRHNPLHAYRARRRTRRHNPLRAYRRRHRNPLGGGILKAAFAQFKDAAIGAVGSIAIDYAYAQLNKSLPTSLQVSPNSVNVGDAIKAFATVAVGSLLSRPTRGLSHKMALGALTVQFEAIVRSMLPASIQSQISGLGYYLPGPVIPGQRWTGPNVRRPGVPLGVLTRHGTPSPALNGLGVLAPNAAPLLSGAPGMPKYGSSLISARHGMGLSR